MNIEARRNLIKTAIKLNRVNRDICPKNFGTYYAHGATGMVKQILPRLTNINASIFIAVSVAARIQHAIGIDADGLSSAGGGAA